MTRIPASTVLPIGMPAAPAPTPPAAVPHEHRHHSHHTHHGHGQASHQLAHQAKAAANQQLARLAKRVRKPRTGKRSAPGSPEEPITDSTFEELLQMLEEHASKNETLVIGPSQQGTGGGQHHSGSERNDQRDWHGRQALLRGYMLDANGNADATDAHAAPAADKRVEAGTATASQASAARDNVASYPQLEAELLAVQQAMRAGRPMPLRLALSVMRAYLHAMPLAGAPGTLAGIRARLLAASAMRGTAPARAASEREQTFNALLPLLLLSAALPRTAQARREGYGRGSALMRRWETDPWTKLTG